MDTLLHTPSIPSTNADFRPLHFVPDDVSAPPLPSPPGPVDAGVDDRAPALLLPAIGPTAAAGIDPVAA